MTDPAIEAAAKAIWQRDRADQFVDGDWKYLCGADTSMKPYYVNLARATLEAAGLPRLRAELAQAREEAQKLRELLRECSDDLAAEIEARYGKTLDYPSQRAHYDRDMVPVVNARAALSPPHGEAGSGTETPHAIED